MAKDDLTAQRLRELLDYDPDTGVFTRKAVSGATVQHVARWMGKTCGSPQPRGYLTIFVDGFSHTAHRLAWLYVHGAWPKHQIDHMNGIRTDNRIANLRDVEERVNHQNIQRAKSNSKSGLLGASLHKASGLWFAPITVNGKRRSLGYFKTAEEAHQAYLAAKRKLHEGCTI